LSPVDIFSIKNKVIIISGGGRGIGEFIAKEMHKRKAIVYCLDLNFTQNTKNKNYFCIKCNITNQKKVNLVIKKIYETHKHIDVLINSAGITLPQKNHKEYSLGDWEKTLKINLTGAFITSNSVIKYMKKNREGSIINITSLNAEQGFPDNPAYVASKGGLKMLSKSLAKDYGIYGIRINNLGPGYIKTEMTLESFKDSKKRKQRQKHVLLDRWGTMDDLLGPCIFLASDASGYVTGQDLYVDGGWLANGLIHQ